MDFHFSDTKKKSSLLKYLLIGLFTYGLLEIACVLFFPVLTGASLSFTATSDHRAQRIKNIELLNDVSRESNTLYSLHPYTGYTGRPGMRPWGDSDTAFNEFGMASPGGVAYPYKRKGNEIVIGIFGGSVAEIFANEVHTDFSALVKKVVGGDRDVVIINLATGGYKQPQQLMILQYALLSGFEFDIIINIDGFNDLALARHNIQNEINPLYPSGFHMGLMSQLVNTSLPQKDVIQLLAEYYDLLASEKSMLSTVNQFPLCYSPFFNLLGEVWTQRSSRQYDLIKYAISVTAQKNTGNEFKGPSFVSNANGKYGDVVAIWSQSSRMMHAIASARQMMYVHVLQPNQYVEGSKPLAEEEKKVAVMQGHAWGMEARQGYRYLVDEGKNLKKAGVLFYDLSMIFKNTRESLYIDNCCHFNNKGNLILAEKLAKIVRDHYQSR